MVFFLFAQQKQIEESPLFVLDLNKVIDEMFRKHQSYLQNYLKNNLPDFRKTFTFNSTKSNLHLAKGQFDRTPTFARSDAIKIVFQNETISIQIPLKEVNGIKSTHEMQAKILDVDVSGTVSVETRATDFQINIDFQMFAIFLKPLSRPKPKPSLSLCLNAAIDNAIKRNLYLLNKLTNLSDYTANILFVTFALKDGTVRRPPTLKRVGNVNFSFSKMMNTFSLEIPFGIDNFKASYNCIVYILGEHRSNVIINASNVRISVKLNIVDNVLSLKPLKLNDTAIVGITFSENSLMDMLSSLFGVLFQRYLLDTAGGIINDFIRRTIDNEPVLKEIFEKCK